MTKTMTYKRVVALAIPVLLVTAALVGYLPADNDKEVVKDRAAVAGPSAAESKTNPPAADQTRSATPPQATIAPAIREDAENSVVNGEPSFQLYHCAPGSAQAIAARLQEQFGTTPGVRIVPDERTSQVLVIAPPTVQARIAGRVSDELSKIAPAPPVQQPSVAERAFPVRPAAAQLAQPSVTPVEAVTSREIQLWNSTSEQFETALTGTLGQRLSQVPGTPDVANYRLSISGGQSLDLSINRPTNRVTVTGTGTVVGSAAQLIHAMDSPQQSVDRTMGLVSLKAARSADVERAVDAIRTGQTPGVSTAIRPRTSQVAMVLQQPAEGAQPTTPGAPTAEQPVAPDVAEAEPPEETAGLIGQVQIEMLPGLDVLVIRGHERDVQQAIRLIEQIEELSKITEPAIKIIPLKNVNCQSLAALLNELYEEVFSLRQGDVSITALVKPNALLLIGQDESVKMVIELAQRLDKPVPPETQFEVFRLKNASSVTAQETVQEYFEQRADDAEEGLGPQVVVTADFRTNSLIVHAGPRDLAEVAAIIARLDAGENETFNEIRVFKLKNSMAEDLAPIIQDAITGQMYGQQTGQRMTRQISGQRESFERKSIVLQFVTVNGQGERLLKSGILTDAQVTADPNANALIVTASADSMPLIKALIEELDGLPTAEAQVKVFAIVHGDASNLLDMLEELFGAQVQAGQPNVRTGATEGDSSLVQMRFAVDVRTNSILATGSMGDLEVVEAILTRLDESDLRKRKTVVYRLKNAYAENVAAAITDFLSSELDAQQPVAGMLSSIEQLEREVVVVAEIITNSLIVSATPRFFQQVTDLVDQLDKRLPQVMIQVVMAEVQLNETDEFGVELGLQDSVLFDRSVAQAGELAGTSIPGFLFNTVSALGNSNAAQAAANAALVGSQGISSFSMGRSNSDLGYGGLVLSASSESVNILLRALQENRRVQVLARPQIQTLDAVMATIHVGEQVPLVRTVSQTNFGQTFGVEPEDVGLVLNVTPRINPDGLVSMEVVASQSAVGPEAEGIPISINAAGDVIRQPRIEIIEARTTVTVMDGHTVVLGGLITTRDRETHRQVPGLGSIPLLGRLFRYDGVQTERNELLMILTPRVVESEEDMERIKQVESARMNWCLYDVIDLHDGDGLQGPGNKWYDSEGVVVYPDLISSGMPSPASVETFETPEIVPDLQPQPDDDLSPFQPEGAPKESVEDELIPAPDPMSKSDARPKDDRMARSLPRLAGPRGNDASASSNEGKKTVNFFFNRGTGKSD